MKQKALVFVSAVMVIGLSILGYFVYHEYKLEASITKNEGDYVVLVHGLGRTSWSMHKIGRHLAQEGYKVVNINYPSMTDSVENLSDTYLKKEFHRLQIKKDEHIHFVTHSMGGILVRYFLAHNELEQVKRVVMIAPPNQGSKTADKWLAKKVGKKVLGQALEDLGTHHGSLANSIPAPSYEVGIIAGAYDEKVDVERTKLEEMKDFLLVQREHTFIMNAEEVIDATIHFLREGTF